MELRLKITKTEVDTSVSNDIHTEEFRLNFGHIFRGKDGVGTTIIPISHTLLIGLRDAGELTKGAFYRITDYECTTTQANTRSANHPFDIIIQALDERTLSENASAIQHEGDIYFADAKLEAWQLMYAIDNDPSRFSWAKEKVIEQSAKWSCGWGVLEEKNSTDVSSNYEVATIDGKQMYLYKPITPNNDFLREKITAEMFYREVEVGSITSTYGFIYEADDPIIYNEEEEYYEYYPYEIRVKTENGQLIATLYNSYDNIYYDSNDGSQEYTIGFEGNNYEEVDGVYHLHPSWGLDGWWDGFMGGAYAEYEREYYTGSADVLYYAFSNPLDKYTTEVTMVTDKNHLYKYEDTDYEDWEEGYWAIDYVSYKAYIAPVESGKGIVYRMIDEHNNDCPYDFKNLQFYNNSNWYYTFSQNGRDLSLTDYCIENFILPHTNQNFSDGTTAVKTIIPMVVFDMKSNASGKFAGILHNKLQVPITKGYLAGIRIVANEWYDIVGGSNAIVADMRIVSSGVIYGNRIYGPCSNFEVGTISKPISSFYANDIVLPNFQAGVFKCLCSVFNNNTVNLSEGKRGFTITSGSIISCDMENSYYVSTGTSTSDDISLGANVVLRNSRIRIFNDLTIQYANTTSSTSPLRFLDIDARGWSATTITIPTTFPANATYGLKVAKNSKGEIKMWCDADLIQ